MKTEEIDKKIGMPDVDEEWSRFERNVIDQPRLATSTHSWMSRAAAIALICVVSGLVLAASFYLYRKPVAPDTPMTITVPEQPASAYDCELEPVEAVLLSCWDEAAGMYVFDNKELQLIAEALSLLYPVEPVFLNDEARHIRLYISIAPGEKSIEEIVTLLNTFYHVRMRLEDDRLIIE